MSIKVETDDYTIWQNESTKKPSKSDTKIVLKNESKENLVDTVKKESEVILNTFAELQKTDSTKNIGQKILNGKITKSDINDIKNLISTGNHAIAINYINMILRLYNIAKKNNIAADKDRGIIKSEFSKALSELSIYQLKDLADPDLYLTVVNKKRA